MEGVITFILLAAGTVAWIAVQVLNPSLYPGVRHDDQEE